MTPHRKKTLHQLAAELLDESKTLSKAGHHDLAAAAAQSAAGLEKSFHRQELKALEDAAENENLRGTAERVRRIRADAEEEPTL